MNELLPINLQSRLFRIMQTRSKLCRNRRCNLPHINPPDPSLSQSSVLHTAFCKVTFTTGSGSADSNVLILEGTSTAGTECAWEFLSDSKQMAQLRSQSHAKSNRMPHFEVLLRTSNLAGDATANTIVASRILP